MIRRPERWLPAWLALSVLLSALCYWQANQSLARDLSARLQQQLPEKLDWALQNRFRGSAVFDLVEEKLNRDLSSLATAGRLPLFNHCRGRVTQLAGRKSGGGDISLGWRLGGEAVHTGIALDCHTDWPLLLGSQSLLALLFVGLLYLLPAPLSAREQARLSALRKAGLAGGQVLASVREPPQLSFDTVHGTVSAGGIPLALSRTPFFYYLWYARLRLQGDGWRLNPATNRADREGAASLVELMERHGGHSKAINDLRQQGLRAKVLDQNRNKIKDQLVAALGEELAQDFLFEAERDMKTGRYRYRIATSPQQIEVV